MSSFQSSLQTFKQVSLKEIFKKMTEEAARLKPSPPRNTSQNAKEPAVKFSFTSIQKFL
jgi:hypothetical protein